MGPGFVGGGGSTSTFNLGGGGCVSAELRHPTARRCEEGGVSPAAPERRVNRPSAANVKVELDWLTQATVDEYDDDTDDYEDQALLLDEDGEEVRHAKRGLKRERE